MQMINLTWIQYGQLISQSFTSAKEAEKYANLLGLTYYSLQG